MNKSESKREARRMQMRRSAAGRLAMALTPSGRVRIKPAKKMTSGQWVEIMAKRFTRPELWEIFGRIAGRPNGHNYHRATKLNVAKWIVSTTCFRCGMTMTALDAACALPEGKASVKSFLWVLNPNYV